MYDVIKYVQIGYIESKNVYGVVNVSFDENDSTVTTKDITLANGDTKNSSGETLQAKVEITCFLKLSKSIISLEITWEINSSIYTSSLLSLTNNGIESILIVFRPNGSIEIPIWFNKWILSFNLNISVGLIFITRGTSKSHTLISLLSSLVNFS